MLDQTTEEVPGLTEAIHTVEALRHNMPDSFSALRQRTHSLAMPPGIQLYGPEIVAEGARIEIMDGRFRTLAPVYLPIPKAWRDNDW